MSEGTRELEEAALQRYGHWRQDWLAGAPGSPNPVLCRHGMARALSLTAVRQPLCGPGKEWEGAPSGETFVEEVTVMIRQTLGADRPCGE